MSSNKGKKPKIFVKKRPEDISSAHDEFYEYDSIKSKNNTLDESFFEEFKSVDFEKLNYDKEHASSEDINDENISSSSIVQDENVKDITKIQDNIETSESQAEISSVDEKLDEELLNDKNDETEEIEIVEEPSVEIEKEENNINFEDEDDDDFGSLDSEEETVSEDTILTGDSEKASLVEEKNDDNSNEDINEEDSIFNQYSISNEEESNKEGNYDSLFEKAEVIIPMNDIQDDDDDFGSLEETSLNISQNTITTQKGNYDDLIDTTDELDEYYDEEDDDEDDEYYIDKKGNKKKRRKGIRLFFKFLLAFLLATSALIVYFGLTHDLFKIDYINVVGNIANEKEILIAKSGVSVGDNIFLASSSKIKKNLKQLSNIEDVKVTKNYPNILEIEVKENFVSAYINTASGLTTIDNYGKVKEVATDNSKASGTQLKGITETGLKVGEDFSKDESKVKFLLNLLTKEYYSDIVSIDFTNDQEIILEFKNSLKVTFGDLKDYAKKTQIIGILIKKIQLEGINATEIILNVGENPIIVKK